MEADEHNGDDQLGAEKTSSQHPDGSSHLGDEASGLGLPGSVDGPSPTTVGEWAKGERVSGAVDETDAQPSSSGAVLAPRTSDDGG
jgi:hypothetical protein